MKKEEMSSALVKSIEQLLNKFECTLELFSIASQNTERYVEGVISSAANLKNFGQITNINTKDIGIQVHVSTKNTQEMNEHYIDKTGKESNTASLIKNKRCTSYGKKKLSTKISEIARKLRVDSKEE